jgi:hypothetical protein
MSGVVRHVAFEEGDRVPRPASARYSPRQTVAWPFPHEELIVKPNTTRFIACLRSLNRKPGATRYQGCSSFTSAWRPQMR